MSRCEKAFWLKNPNIRPCCCVSRVTGSVPKTFLPNLLRNVNRSASARVFPRSCYKLSTAEVSGSHHDANNKGGYERFHQILSTAEIFSPQQLQIYSTLINLLNASSPSGVHLYTPASSSTWQKTFPTSC